MYQAKFITMGDWVPISDFPVKSSNIPIISAERSKIPP